MTHGDNHPVCGGCYIAKVSARLPEDAPVLEQTIRCCSCGRPISALIYWRIEPVLVWMLVPHCPDIQVKP